MGGADWEKAAARCASAVRDIAGELVVLYRRRLHGRATRSGPTRRGRPEIEDAFPYEETPDQARRSSRPRPTWSGRCRWTAWCAATSVRQDRGRAARRVQGGVGRQAGRDPRPTTLLASSTANVPRALRHYPGRVEVLSPLPHAGQGTDRRRARRRRRARSTSSIGTHRLLCEDSPSRTWACSSSTRSSASACSTRSGIKQMRDERRRAHAHGHADPAHARDVAHGHSRPVARQHAARDRQPILTYVGEPDDDAVRRRPSAASCARGPGPLRAQPRAGHRARRRADVRELVPEARVAVGHGQMDEGELERGRARVLRARVSTCSCARRSSRAASTCRR